VNFWDDRFAEPGFAYGTAPNDFLREQAGRIPPGPVLCLAEGEGRNAAFLAGLGHQVVAVDQSAVGLAKAARLAEERKLHISTIVADLRDYRIAPAGWAAIVSIFVHLPPALRTTVYRGVVAGLQPGGVLILEAYAPGQLAHGTGGPRDADRLATLDQLRDELTGLELLVAREAERDLHEGRYHDGRSSVVQIVGIAPRGPVRQPA
jgi:SAM-dependent methyltransferase